jgi:predicted GH43/DUF377 family glycosyl hydrolase
LFFWHIVWLRDRLKAILVKLTMERSIVMNTITTVTNSLLHSFSPRKKTNAVLFMFLAIQILSFLPEAHGQFVWQKHATPVLKPGPEGAWDDGPLSEHSVILKGGVYHMWYNSSGESRDIGYATSPDGVTWTKHPGNPVIKPGQSNSWEGRFVSSPAVIVESGTLKMWYRGYDSRNESHIGLAFSTNGITWTRYPQNPVLTIGAGEFETHAVVYDGKTYHLWYYNHPSVQDIKYASSPDGIHWIKLQFPVLSEKPHIAALPTVVFDGKTFHLWYATSRSAGIYYATSNDGVNWTKYPSNPVFYDPAGTGGYTAVVFDGTKFHLWYNGASGIMYANSMLQTAVAGEESKQLPNELVLYDNYPNPFNPSTTIRYSLAQAGHVSLKIFNLAGQEIATLVDGKQNAGEHHVQWQAAGVPSGVYFYQLRAGEKVETRKMILAR